jgi:hypothetical protein
MHERSVVVMASLPTDFIIAAARAYRDLPEDEQGSEYGRGFLDGQAETASHLAEPLGSEEMAFFVANAAELIRSVAERDLDAYRRANPHAVEIPGDMEVEPYFPLSIPPVPRTPRQSGTETVTAGTPTIATILSSLHDGDVFSLDDGTTWHCFAVLGFGTVSVYSGPRRDADAPCIRIDAERDQKVLVRAR